MTVVTGELTMEEIVGTAATVFGVSVAELVGHSRVRPLISYRHATIATCRRLTGSSYQSIATVFGDRDHCTVMSSVARVATDADLATLARRLVDVVEGGLR